MDRFALRDGDAIFRRFFGDGLAEAFDVGTSVAVRARGVDQLFHQIKRQRSTQRGGTILRQRFDLSVDATQEPHDVAGQFGFAFGERRDKRRKRAPQRRVRRALTDSLEPDRNLREGR